MHDLITNFIGIFQQFGYPGIVVMMAVESSFFPLPSEIVIPPAAYLAAKGELNLVFVILAGTLGSVIGASFNYALALWLGRPLVYKIVAHRYSRLLMIDQKKMQKAEDYFLKNANMSTFIGRLVLAVRHLISFPAGFCRMNFKDFIFFTALGSFIWVTILSLLGYFFGANQDLLLKYYKEFSILLLLVFIIFVFYLVRKNKNKKEINP